MLEWPAPADVDTTFVLVHGFLDLAYGWHEVAPLLGAHVIAVDLRGHGDSDWIGPGGYYHYMDYVADLDDVIARLARKRVIVVGHSMGGGVASYWAGTRPERAAALAVLEGLGPPDQSDAPLPARTAMWIDAWKVVRAKPIRPMATLADAAARLRKHDPMLGEALALRLARAGTREAAKPDTMFGAAASSGGAKSDTMSGAAASSGGAKSDTMSGAAASSGGAGGFLWKHDPLHATMGPYPFRRDHAAQYWKRVACPVLAIDGAESRLNLGEAERASRRAEFARCRHVVLAGAGHMMQRHQPAALAKLLAELRE